MLVCGDVVANFGLRPSRPRLVLAPAALSSTYAQNRRLAARLAEHNRPACFGHGFAVTDLGQFAAALDQLDPTSSQPSRHQPTSHDPRDAHQRPARCSQLDAVACLGEPRPHHRHQPGDRAGSIRATVTVAPPQGINNYPR